MNRDSIKKIIIAGVILSSFSTIMPSVVVTANDVNNIEYNTIFSDDEREILAYEQLRIKWVELLTGNSLSGKNDTDAMNNIKKMENKAAGLVSSANFDEQSKYVWSSLVDEKSHSATITAHFKAIKELAILYNAKDSIYYQNNEFLSCILNSVKKMYQKHYNENIKSMPNNWWDWQIGTPKELVDIMILLDAELGDLKVGLIKTIDRFVPDATKRLGQADSFKETGANLIDKAQVIAIRGIFEGNGERIEHSANAIKDVFPYVTKGDGYYIDGSFIQHGDIAYTGSYGAVLLNGLSNCLYIIQDTQYKIDTKDYYNLFRWIKDSYEPIIANGGNVLDNVRGRAISRIAQQGDNRGKFIIGSMLRIAEIAPNSECENYIKGITKKWLKEGEANSNNYFDDVAIGDIANMKSVINDVAVQEAKRRNSYKQFYYMDRFVANRNDYTFTASMSSSRIANHEDINGESTKAWHTGQGMTQIYTNDLAQYNEDFWPTVDPMRLPGITTDGQTRKFSDKSNSSAFAGGTTIDGINGVSGMEILPNYRTIDNKETGMSARKSWFAFEDAIVAVGSNISSSDKMVETIVDNRKIKDSTDNILLVDGKEVNKNLGEEKVKANWAHLEGNVKDSDIGYIFLDETEIVTKRETRTNKWSEINTKAEFTDTSDKTKSYISLAINHGEAAKNEKYAYVILPNATAKETKVYSSQKNIEVLANNDKYHAVYNKNQDIYAINVFEKTKLGETLEIDGPASIMIKKEKGGNFKIAISNPTKKQDELNIKINSKKIQKFNVTGDAKKIDDRINVDTSSKTGETYEFTISKKS